MPTQFVTGDLFATTGLDGIAHGCNCAGAMGKGIAVEFKRRFPEMYEEYRRRCRDGRFALGDVLTWKTREVVVFNLGTQKNWRSRAVLDAVTRSLQTMVTEAEAHGVRRLGLPAVGAGLGGLDWRSVRRTLEGLGEQTDIELVVFERFEAGVGLTFP